MNKTNYSNTGLGKKSNNRLIKEVDADFVLNLEMMITQEMTRLKVPGLSIAIVQDTDIKYIKGFGYMNIKKNIKANKETIYRIASLTKSFTCFAILILQEQGKLNVHDPISNYIPCSLDTKEHPITIHHLMTHTSGITEITTTMEDGDRPLETRNIPFSTWGDFFDHINGANEFLCKPGIRQYYSNEGYSMLGRIVENVSGIPLNEFFKNQIFEPLQMDHSTLFRKDINSKQNLTVPYEFSSRTNKIEETLYYDDHHVFLLAAGGMYSTVSELANYLIMHLNKGVFNKKQVIEQELLDLMHTQHYQETARCRLYGRTIGDFGKAGYGYGFGVHDNFYGYKLVHHSGSWTNGSSSWIAMLPQLKIGVVILANKHPSPRMFALSTLAMMIGIKVSKEFPLFRYRNHISRLIGEYKLYRGLASMNIISQGGMLYFKFPYGGIDVPLIPSEFENEKIITLNYHILTEIGEKDPVIFEIDDRGSMWMNHSSMRWKKQ